MSDLAGTNEGVGLDADESEPAATDAETTETTGTTGAAAEEERRVGWAELLFDLVFVVAVTRTSALVAADTDPGGLLRSLIVFVPMYWLWVGTAIQTNLQGAEAPRQRVRLFAIALAAVFMATAVPTAYGSGALVFALGYWLGRLVLGLPVVLPARDLRTPYGVSIVLTGPLLIVGAVLGGPAQEAIWGFVAVADLATPWVFHRVLKAIHYDAGHLVERYGLFVLIALGESMVALVPRSLHLMTVSTGAAVAAAFVVVCGSWWLYFSYTNAKMRRALEATEVQITLVRNVLSYGHLAFIASIIVMAVGIQHAISAPGRQLTWPTAGLLYGGAAAYCATFGFTRWVMWHRQSWRVLAALVVLALLPGVANAPALAGLVVLAVVIVGVNMVEWYRIEVRAARRARA